MVDIVDLYWFRNRVLWKKMVEKTTETLSWSTFISLKYASTLKIMISAQCKTFGSKKGKQLSVPFTEIFERRHFIRNMLQDENIAKEWN